MRPVFKILAAVSIFAAGLAVARAAVLTIGSRTADFALPAVSGGTGEIRLTDELKKNRLTVLMFIATKCPVSNAYNERMEALEKDYAGKGVRFLGINSNVSESVEEIAAHSKEHGFTFAVLKDAESRVADLYDARHTPEIYVVDAGGALRYHGRIDESWHDAAGARSPDLRNALDALLAGKPVPAPETKAMGCSIKRP